MKKMTCFVMALALVLGLAQCKKEQPTPQGEGNVVMITLDLDGGESKDTRAEVHPPHVNFENGDQILVASGGTYVGALTRENNVFSGNITDPEEGQPLYFYFLGNKQGELENGATNCTVNISDQSNYPHLPVISMGKSTVDYSTDVTSYSSRLYNKASLMKFNVNTGSDEAICITGMNNMVMIDFSDPSDSGFTYDMNQEDGGLIKMPAKDGNNVTWAIVLPQEAMPAGAEGTAYTYDGYKGNRPALDAIVANKYITSGVDILNVNTFDINYMPLTFEAKATNSTITFNAASSITMQYNTYDGMGWKPYTSGTSVSLAEIGNKVSFRGDNNTLAHNPNNCSKFSVTTGQCYIYGNIMSLLSSTDYATATTLTSNYTFSRLFFNTNNTSPNIYSHSSKELVLPATTLTKWCYSEMFSGCSNLTSAPALPATTLAQNCYTSMFNDCTSLASAPTLSATTLAASCYTSMFYGCTSLTSAPALPATTLAESCYYSMFQGCNGLASAPALPATTLVPYCYTSMFQDCTNLRWSPDLQAMTLTESCYQSMFKGCTDLVWAPALSATTLAPNCYTSMFQDCTNLVEPPDLQAMTLAESCYQSMFKGCSSLIAAPVLPATELVEGCYVDMFNGCSSLNCITCLANNPSYWYTGNWVSGVSGNGRFYKAFNVRTWPSGVDGIPNGWTVEDRPY